MSFVCSLFSSPDSDQALGYGSTEQAGVQEAEDVRLERENQGQKWLHIPRAGEGDSKWTNFIWAWGWEPLTADPDCNCFSFIALAKAQ